MRTTVFATAAVFYFGAVEVEQERAKSLSKYSYDVDPPELA